MSNLTDNQIMDSATKIFNTQNIDASKTKRVEDMKQKPIKSEEKKASFKQINLLKKLGYKGNLDLTMKEASGLISEYKSRDQYD